MSSLFGRRRAPVTYCLANLAYLELGMAEIEALVISSLLMCGAEGFGSSPCFEGRAAFPHGVGCIESVVLTHGAFEKVEFDKSRHGIKVGVAGQPHSLE